MLERNGGSACVVRRVAWNTRHLYSRYVPFFHTAHLGLFPAIVLTGTSLTGTSLTFIHCPSSLSENLPSSLTPSRTLLPARRWEPCRLRGVPRCVEHAISSFAAEKYFFFLAYRPRHPPRRHPPAPRRSSASLDQKRVVFSMPCGCAFHFGRPASAVSHE